MFAFKLVQYISILDLIGLTSHPPNSIILFSPWDTKITVQPH